MELEEVTTALAESLLNLNKVVGEVIDNLLEKKIDLGTISGMNAVCQVAPILRDIMLDAYVANGLAADDLMDRMRKALGTGIVTDN